MPGEGGKGGAEGFASACGFGRRRMGILLSLVELFSIDIDERLAHAL